METMNRKGWAVASVLVLAILAILLAPALAPRMHLAGAQPVEIRRALGGPPPSDIMATLFVPWMQQNVLKHYGKKYTLKIIPTPSTTIAASLLAAEEADMGTLAISTLASVIQKDAIAGGVSVVGDTKIDGYPGFRSIVWSVRADSGINRVEDLKGKTIAVNTYGAIVDVAARVVLRKHGLDPEKDLRIVEVQFPNIGKAIRDGRIAAGPLLQPFEEVENQKGGLKPIFHMKDAYGPAQMIFQAVRNKFKQQHPEALRAYLEDYQTALKWFKDPANRPKMVQLVAEATKRPADLYNRYLLTEKDDYRDTSVCPYLEYIQRPLELIHEVGVLKERVDVSSAIDTSFLPGPCAKR